MTKYGKAYHFYAQQLKEVGEEMRRVEEALLSAWEREDTKEARVLEAQLDSWDRVIVGLDYSMQNNTVRPG
ncbi:MAG: hypothetical protein GF349_00155 [Candidatus Magasanikbacteria bacterium]|nr:hypothetical protein [Candidatus Magasanikbacteria bacterium]